jgi:hypothetical protein
VAFDVPVYGSRYIKSNNQSTLKHLPFKHEQPAIKPVTIESPLQLLNSDIKLRDYYTSFISRDVLARLREAVESRAQTNPIWTRKQLIESVRSAMVYPSLRGLSEASIMAIVVSRADFFVTGEYICFERANQ